MREALLAAVCESPDDDLPRLAFADWCEENGDAPRAEFIRAQIKLAKIDEGDPRHEALTQRAHALLAANAEVWQSELPRWARPNGYSLGYYGRGFLRCVVCTAKQWLRSGKSLRHKAPIERLCLSNVLGKLGELCRHPGLLRVRELEVTDGLKAEDVRDLAKWSPAATLLDLNLAHCHLADAGVTALAMLPWLPRLRSLSLSYNSISTAGTRALAAAPLTGLESLVLIGNPVTDPGLEALTASPHLVRLARLSLIGCSLGPRAARALAGTNAPLTELDLAGTRVGGEGLAALADSPALAGLRSLRLTGARIGVPGVEALARSSHLRRLELLNLSANDLSDAAAVALAGWPGAASLRDLILTDTSVGDGGAVALADSPHLAGLHFLRIANCLIGDDGALAFGGSRYLRGLRLLVLRGNRGIGEVGRRALVERVGERVLL